MSAIDGESSIEQGIYFGYQDDVSIRIGRNNNPTTFFSNITSSGNVSSSTTSTASFGSYLGDGSQLTGVNSTPSSGTYSSSLQVLGNITSSGNISASGTIEGGGIYLGGVLRNTWPAASAGEWALVGSAQTSSLDVIVDGFISASNIDFNTPEGRIKFEGVGDYKLQILDILGNEAASWENLDDVSGGGAQMNVGGNISASGYISASRVSAPEGFFDLLEFDTILMTSSLMVDDLSINGDLNLSGSGVPTIESDSNLILSASNGAVVIKDKLNLNPTGTGSVASPINGDIVYDTADHKFYGYANGSWVAFH